MTDIARVRATISGIEGGTGLATFYFAGPGAVDANIALEGAKRVRAFFNGAVAQISLLASVQVQSQVDVLTAETGVLSNSFGVAAQAVVTGTATGAVVSGATQGLLQLHTGALIAGRRVNGRSNVPSPVVGATNGFGVPTTAYITAVQTAGALLNTLILTACSNVVWHRPKSGAGGSAVLVTSYSCSPKWATLRSRRD